MPKKELLLWAPRATDALPPLRRAGRGEQPLIWRHLEFFVAKGVWLDCWVAGRRRQMVDFQLLVEFHSPRVASLWDYGLASALRKFFSRATRRTLSPVSCVPVRAPTMCERASRCRMRIS
jgi:hypothetical protein